MDGKELGAMPFHGLPDVVSEIGNHYAVGHDGITLRQHFAGLAMGAICYHSDYPNAGPELVAAAAVELADALLAELAKPAALSQPATQQGDD